MGAEEWQMRLVRVTQAALSILGLLMVWNEETLRRLMFEPTLR